MKMTNETYDIIKIVALLILPISEFVGSLASIWGLPYGKEITATLVAFDVLFGVVVKIASDYYARNKEGENND